MSYTEWFCEDLQDLLDLTPKKDVLFIIGLFPTPWTAAYQAPPSMGFVRQEYWSGVPLPSLVIIGHRNAKVGSHEPLGVTGKFGLGIWNEAGQRLTVLPRKCTGHSKHPLPTTQEKTLHMDITRWPTLKSD